MHTVHSSDTSGLFIGTVFVGGIDSNEWHTTFKVNERDITFKLDTGADANVPPLDVYQQVLSDVPMTRTDTILTAFGNSKIHPEGEVKLEVKCQETSITKILSFCVTSASDIAILGCKACTAMNLVTRVAIDSVSNITVLTKDSLFEIYETSLPVSAVPHRGGQQRSTSDPALPEGPVRQRQPEADTQ